ncbi:MAG: GAF domain-containing protein, partial [Gemmatimonadetes bacterium]|nr:GAF domain-containing protein [Gemmatimonadota bacterium]
QAGQVIVDFLPELGRILGPQPAVAELGPAEAQNRFSRLFREFVRATTGPERPLVLFLDDLQWIDSASRDLMRVVLSNWPSSGLLVVGAFRNNEVGPDHPLMELIQDLSSSGTSVSSIRLEPLGQESLDTFVADSLRGDAEHGAPLASLIARKTGGNPFFVTQFMRSLAERDLLVPDRSSGVWAYDLDGIEKQPSTPNVVDLLAGRIERLPDAACEALKMAACLGNRFDERTLTIVSGGDRQQVRESLRVALAEGFLLRGDEVGDANAGTPEGEGPSTYRFLHDRVQQAAYVLIPRSERAKVHVGIGRSLFAELSEAECRERASELIDYLRPGLHLVEESDEARTFFDLALAAGQKARGETAYAEALEYFRVGAQLSPSEAWDSEYRSTFDLHLVIAECEYLSGHFDEGFLTLDDLARRAMTPIDRARVQILRAAQYETMSAYADAVEALRQGLAPLGIDFPERDSLESAVEREIDASQAELGERDISDLIDLPALDDAAVKMCMRLLAFAWAPSYLLADVGMISWIPAKMVRLSLAHGNTEESALGYVVHGFTLGTRRGDYETGYEFGLLGVALNESLEDLRLRGKVHELFGCFVKQWRAPLADCIDSQRTAFNAGLESGDFAYGSYGGFVETWYSTLTRERLDGLEADYEPVMEFLRSIKNDAFLSAERLMLNWSLALRGRTDSPLSLDGVGFSEEDYLAGFGRAPFFRVFYDIIRLHLHVTMGRYDEAVRVAAAAEEVVHSVSGTIWPMLLCFYRAMAIAGSTPRGTTVPEGHKGALSRDGARLSEWAVNCPENFAHADLLVQAEVARLETRDQEAADLYAAALDAARIRGFPGDIALANERYGRYWLERGQSRIGAFFLGEAADAYQSWGAQPAAERLRDEVAARSPTAGTASRDVSPAFDLLTPKLDLASPSDSLDFQWAMRAAGALASEIELDDLLRTLTKTLIESAGAERGGLFLGRGEDTTLRVWWDTHTGEVSLRAEPLDPSAEVPHSILRYVDRTSSRFVLDDAMEDPAFVSDPYVLAHRPRSVACLPVLHQGELLGAVYLENGLDRGVFTGGRLRLLETLTAHAAIAIRNS